MSEFIFFWKPTEQNGVFGNWFPSPFTLNNINYFCVEQYIMHKKALLFNDIGTATKIMKTQSPRSHRIFGRQVKEFDDTVWNNNKERILYEGLFGKFSQNINLRKELLATEDKILVEASPLDKIYGIGLSKDNPKAQDPQKWLGQNLLGNTLMKVRTDLRI